MSYLIRVLIPDAPGSLGRVAEAIGNLGGDISSVDVVEQFHDGRVMDDMVVTLPTGTMADALITAAEAVEDVTVDSIQPFSGRVDRRGQIELLSSVAGASTRSEALVQLINRIPQALTSSWAILLDTSNAEFRRITASEAAPEDDGSSPPTITLDHARILSPESESWIPSAWSLLDSSLAASPLPGRSMMLVIGRVGGPDFLPSEVQHIGHLCAILARVLQ